MNKDDCENVARLAVILGRLDAGRHSAGVAMSAAELATIGKTLHRLAEISCETGEVFDHKIHKLVTRAREILAAYQAGLQVEYQGDPRGYALRIKFSGGETNNWGGDFGV